MNQTHIHLFINHLPIFGSLLGGILLCYALWIKSNDTKIAAYILFVLSSIGATIAYLTGEAAEETVEHITGVFKDTIKTHEAMALFAIIALGILGVASIVGLYVTFKKSFYTRSAAFIILFISFISFGLIARTGYLGGKIRHTELSNNAAVDPKENRDKEDKDE